MPILLKLFLGRGGVIQVIDLLSKGEQGEHNRCVQINKEYTKFDVKCLFVVAF